MDDEVVKSSIAGVLNNGIDERNHLSYWRRADGRIQVEKYDSEGKELLATAIVEISITNVQEKKSGN